MGNEDGCKKKTKRKQVQEIRLVEKVTEAQMKAVCGRSGTGGEGGGAQSVTPKGERSQLY